MTSFRSHLFDRVRFSTFATPRRPRNPLLRIALGVVGVALLLALLFVSVFVGLAMLAAGLLYRLLKQRRTPMAVRTRSIDGQPLEGAYRVVAKAQLPLAR